MIGRKNICSVICRRFIAQNLIAKLTKLNRRHNLSTDLLLISPVAPDFSGQELLSIWAWKKSETECTL